MKDNDIYHLKEKTKHSSALSGLLNFTDADLKANRAGRLSGAQSIRLLNTLLINSFLCLTGIAFGSMIFIMGLFLFMMPWLIRYRGPDISDLVLAGIVFMLLIGIPLYGLVKRVWHTWRTIIPDLRHGSVYEITGSLTKFAAPVDKRKTTQYMIKVGNDAFPVSVFVFNAFGHGDIYRLYCAPETHTLLSAELIQVKDRELDEDMEEV